MRNLRAAAPDLSPDSVTHVIQGNDYVTPSFVTAWARLSGIRHARRGFDKTAQPNGATWNATFRGYAQAECHLDVVVSFARMHRAGAFPNCF
ncbi:hypothetical protein D0Y65_024675 [Glycine soja]|uniref:Uncharacterized protein n=1 Tax=Glycine soja TaxID=3848 RepID=A0A445J3D5_GLYSO|nr:hypothetical protein D0Y65_024675 [Glycine soja]